MLNAAAAERELDAVFPLRAAQLGFADEEFAVPRAQSVAVAPERDAAAREIADDRGLRRPLQHLAVTA